MHTVVTQCLVFRWYNIKACLKLILTLQIQELMKEIRLPQGDAVRALENNGLDVNKAIHAVYRDKINSNQLYQYMWGELEGGGIKQIQNNRIEEMITQKLHNDYVSNIYCLSYYFLYL